MTGSKFVLKALASIALGVSAQLTMPPTAVAMEESEHCDECRKDCPNKPDLYCASFLCTTKSASCSSKGCVNEYHLLCNNTGGEE